MKRIIAFLMVALLALPLVACNNNSGDPTATPTVTTPTATPGTDAGTPTPTPTPELQLPLKAGTYSMTHVASGTVLETNRNGKFATGEDVMYSQVSIDWVVLKNKAYYRFGFFGVEQVKNKASGKLLDNNEVISGLTTDRLKNGSEVVLTRASLTDKNQTWVLYPNDDGTFCIAPNLKPTKSRLGFVDGKPVLVDYKEGDDLTNLKWSFKNMSLDNPLYYEYVSEKGNAVVRVPLDVFEAKNYDGAIDKDTMQFKRYVPTEETLQKYAENIQLTWETYVDLTNFVPYNVIILHGYNYQGVMAGVVGNNNNIFVNCGQGEWFYSDLSKMQYRAEKEGKNDVNFMQLHEMGHMFDFARGWTFESEMQADLKASYLLCNLENVCAAPAEFMQHEYFSTDIGSKGYKHLSGGKLPNGVSTNNKYGYSIYRNAQIFTEFCSDHVGWEALKQTFHWFQSEEGLKQCPSSSSSYDKFKTFVDKLSEYGKKDLWAVFDPAELAVLEKHFGKPEEAPETAE